MKALLSSNSQEWFTPKVYVEAARRVMGGIDLDPASCVEANKVVQARGFFSREADGLSRHWNGRVWLNPPYGRAGRHSLAGLWIEAAIAKYLSGEIDQAIVLVNASVGDAWFEQVWKWPVCLVRKRIRFNTPGGVLGPSPTKGNCFVYLGPSYKLFSRHFAPFGKIILPTT